MPRGPSFQYFTYIYKNAVCCIAKQLNNVSVNKSSFIIIFKVTISYFYNGHMSNLFYFSLYCNESVAIVFNSYSHIQNRYQHVSLILH